MLHVASLALSTEQDKANEFFKTRKPVGNSNFNMDTIVVFYEDDPAPELVEVLESVGSPRRYWHPEPTHVVPSPECSDR
jgi:hypothetical protein